MFKECLTNIDKTVQETIDLVNSEKIVLSGKEDIERYLSYTDENKEITEEVIAGYEGSFIDNLFYKIDKAMQTGIRNINRYFISTNVVLDDMEKYETVTPNISDLYKQRDTLLELMKDGSLFYKIANKKAPILASFKLKLKDGVNIVKNLEPIVTRQDSYLSKFENMIDRFMDSKKDNIKLDIDKNEIKAILADVRQTEDALANTTNKKLIVDRKPVKKLVANFIELNTVANDLLILGQTYNMEMLEDLNSRVAAITTKLDIIQNSIAKNKINISKKDMENFINYIGAIAKYTTAVSFVMYFYIQLINMTLGVIKVAVASQEDHSIIDTIAAYLNKNFNIINKYFKS